MALRYNLSGPSGLFSKPEPTSEPCPFAEVSFAHHLQTLHAWYKTRVPELLGVEAPNAAFIRAILLMAWMGGKAPTSGEESVLEPHPVYKRPTLLVTSNVIRDELIRVVSISTKAANLRTRVIKAQLHLRLLALRGKTIKKQASTDPAAAIAEELAGVIYESDLLAEIEAQIPVAEDGRIKRVDGEPMTMIEELIEVFGELESFNATQLARVLVAYHEKHAMPALKQHIDTICLEMKQRCEGATWKRCGAVERSETAVCACDKHVSCSYNEKTQLREVKFAWPGRPEIVCTVTDSVYKKLFQLHEGERFLPHLFCMLRRYESITGKGPTAIYEPSYATFLAGMSHRELGAFRDLGVVGEGISNPLAAYGRNYCSPFPDTDVFFGAGQHATAPRKCDAPAAVVFTPPHVEAVMDDLGDRIVGALEAAGAAPLTFVVFVPDWRTPLQHCQALFEASPFLRLKIDLWKGQHFLAEPQQHLRSNDKLRELTVNHGSYLYVLQTDAGAKQLPLAAAKAKILAALTKA